MSQMMLKMLGIDDSAVDEFKTELKNFVDNQNMIQSRLQAIEQQQADIIHLLKLLTDRWSANNAG